MSERFTVKSVGGVRREWDSLLKELLQAGPPAVSSNLVPAREMFNLLRRRGCKSVVIEDPYMDEDHRMCHARLHHLAQAELSKYCKRLHFFSTNIDVSALRNISEDLREEYMGMSIWRPTNSFPIGRTIITPNGIVKPPTTKRWRPFLTCRAEQLINLAGNEIRIAGAPYIQQDHMVAACATAAVWMAQYYMASRFDGFRVHYSPEITEAATMYDVSYGRSIPSEGLHNGQILQALRALGYDPISYDVVDLSAIVAQRLLYRLIESEIPVIVGLVEPYEESAKWTGHAITAFGHGLSSSIPSLRQYPEYTASNNSLRYIDSSDYSCAFIVNDDAAGLYRWMELVNTKDVDTSILSHIYTSPEDIRRISEFLRTLVKNGITVSAIFYDSSGKPDMLAGIDFLAAPLPPAVTLPPRDAQDKALAAFITAIAAIVNFPLNLLPKFVIRTYLVESNKYKLHIGKVANPTSEFAWWIQSSYLPKWIWVTEISIAKRPRSVVGRKVIASVVIDSSAPRDTLDFVLMHVSGWVIPVERNQLNVVRLIKDIAAERTPHLYDANFNQYAQLERGY